MRAELIIDLKNVGNEVGRALGRDVPVFPSLGTVAELWKVLGVEVSAIRVVTDTASGSNDEASFADLHVSAWWQIEQAFAEDHPFDVSLSLCPSTPDGPIAVHDLITTTALSSSDALADSLDPSLVIVMSNSPEVAPAVTHARGVPVMVAGTVIHDSGLSHCRLELSWMGLLKDRFAAISLPDVELRNGRPWIGDMSVGTPFTGTEGRNEDLAVLPSFAESAAIFDPAHFEVASGASNSSPRDAGLAAVVHTLGLGTLVHIEDVSTFVGDSSQISATIYRYAADNPNSPLVIASTRPSIIALTADLDSFAIANPDRVVRLCLPERPPSAFDEAAFSTRSAACRIVVESTLSEPMFAAVGEPELNLDDPLLGETESSRHLQVVPDGRSIDDVEVAGSGEPVSVSPTLKLYANPNTIREVSGEWREQNKRRFLLLGATGAEATPADSTDGVFLPISLGGCTDFSIRRPALRPGCVVEGVLHSDGGRWLIVSDPIERRRSKRTATAAAA